ncbi:MAG: hypothetical protein IPL79_02385 [Myxococcales bacterium]|nr:hypothetical protein [Myxococcales bacterium]
MGRHSLRSLVLCTALATALAATAHQDVYADAAIPDSFLGIIIGSTTGVGNTSGVIGSGVRYGMEAGWQPMSIGQRFGIGVHWSASGGYYFGVANTAGGVAAGTTLETFSTELTLRLRAAVGTRGWFAHVGAGAGMYRSNLALPPREARSYIGGAAEAGAMYLIGRRSFATINVVLGGISTGALEAPNTVSVVVGASLAL